MDCFSNNFGDKVSDGFMDGAYAYLDFQQSPSSVRRRFPDPLSPYKLSLNSDLEFDDKMTGGAGNSGYGTQDVRGYKIYKSADVNPYKQDSTQYGQSPLIKVTNDPPVLEMAPQEVEDILNAERDNIDTKDLCQKISAELLGYRISQELFAARIINRSQGTLSDLLAKPKPWHILRSGRQTYTRMYNWMCQPLETRMAILYGQPEGEVAASTPSQKKQNKRKSSSGQGEHSAKKQRLVFTDIQKRTLENIFKETQRPDREMQQLIADHLQLDGSTVYNYFMNARRRSNVAKAPDSQWIP